MDLHPFGISWLTKCCTFSPLTVAEVAEIQKQWLSVKPDDIILSTPPIALWCKRNTDSEPGGQIKWLVLFLMFLLHVEDI